MFPFRRIPAFKVCLALASVFALSGLLMSVRADEPLVTGKNISPASAGTQTGVGSLPMNMALSPDGKYALVTSMGFREQLSAIATDTGVLAGQITFGAPGAKTDSANGLYYGLAVAPISGGGATVYAAQGANASIAALP